MNENSKGSGEIYIDPIKSARFSLVTIGKVEDNNDPDQKGRVKARCPFLGDSIHKNLEDIPWAIPVTPFGGSTTGGARSYGNFQIPQDGSDIFVMCLEGDPDHRIYIGMKLGNCPGELPHGRYHQKGNETYGPFDCQDEPVEPFFSNNREMFNKGPSQAVMENDDSYYSNHPDFSGGGGGMPSMSFDESSEFVADAGKSIINIQIPSSFQNIMNNVMKIKGKVGENGSWMSNLNTRVPSTVNKAEKAVEWTTRGIDSSAAAWTNDRLKSDHLSHFPGPKVDCKGKGEWFKVTHVDGSERVFIGKGYAPNIDNADIAKLDSTQIRYSPQTYSMTSPQFHSISMDDRDWNRRLRFRSQAGNTIILDDTNERVYVSTAKGNTWIQLDQEGMVDIFGAKDISIASEENLNLYAGHQVRIAADAGVHIVSEEEIRLHSKSEMHICSNTNMAIRSRADVDVTAMGSFKATAESELSMKAKMGPVYVQSGSVLFLASTGVTMMNYSALNFNSGATVPAPEAADAKEAWVPARIPEHEPWARGWSKPENADGDGKNKNGGGTENSYIAKWNYTDPSNNFYDRNGKKFNRNKYALR